MFAFPPASTALAVGTPDGLRVLLLPCPIGENPDSRPHEKVRHERCNCIRRVNPRHSRVVKKLERPELVWLRILRWLSV
jgi:hypothetical protein